MNRLTRGPIILLAAGIAGFLVWVASRISDSHNGGYWAVYAIIAGAGLVVAASMLAASWSAGRPTMSPSVLLVAFVPVLIVVAWIAVAGQPHGSTTRSHVLTWSGDLGIRGPVHDLIEYIGVLAFGLGAVLGFSLVPGRPPAVPEADVHDWRTQPTAARPVGPVGAGAVQERQPVGAGDGSRQAP
jgi:hypothetical protein